jgi:proteasome accessory factor B
MSTQNRPQHYRIRRMVQMVRESTETGYLANSRDFMNEFEVSRRTVARDLDYLRDEENAPLAYDEARHGYVLTDETYALPPVNISRKEAFSFGLARKLLAHYEGTPLHLDMKAVLDKIAESRFPFRILMRKISAGSS